MDADIVCDNEYRFFGICRELSFLFLAIAFIFLRIRMYEMCACILYYIVYECRLECLEYSKLSLLTASRLYQATERLTIHCDLCSSGSDHDQIASLSPGNHHGQFNDLRPVSYFILFDVVSRRVQGPRIPTNRENILLVDAFIFIVKLHDKCIIHVLCQCEIRRGVSERMTLIGSDDFLLHAMYIHKVHQF